MPICKFYLNGLCTKDDCPYLHRKFNADTELCADFLKGYCEKAEEVWMTFFSILFHLVIDSTSFYFCQQLYCCNSLFRSQLLLLFFFYFIYCVLFPSVCVCVVYFVHVSLVFLSLSLCIVYKASRICESKRFYQKIEESCANPQEGTSK